MSKVAENVRREDEPLLFAANKHAEGLHDTEPSLSEGWGKFRSCQRSSELRNQKSATKSPTNDKEVRIGGGFDSGQLFLLPVGVLVVGLGACTCGIRVRSVVLTGV